jgi:zinc transport system substrate-binding protein
MPIKITCHPRNQLASRIFSMFKHLLRAFVISLFFSVSFGQAAPLNIVVSVAPQRYLVKTIAADNAEVSILIAPGQTPATWDPSPQSMATLASADLLIPIGVPFERVWLPRLQAMFPKLKVAQVLDGVALQSIKSHDHGHHHLSHNHDEMMDPHVWLDPLRCITVGENIAAALIALDPQHQEDYTAGLERLRQQLLITHQNISAQLSRFQGRSFMVFHPSWGYFASRYQMKQLAIETSGKEPSGAQLAETAEFARRNKVRVIFVQEQFSRKAATAIAQQIGATVAVLDPLAEEIPTALQQTADKISTALETPWAQPSH